jgi:hypothetical protein
MEDEKSSFVDVSATTIIAKRPSIASTKFEVRRASGTPGENYKLEKSYEKSKLCYRMADLFMNMLIVFPLSICFWRGVWQLMDYYSELCGADPWLSIGMGYSIPFCMYYFQEPLRTHVIPGRMNFIPFYIISRTLLLLHSFGSVNQWRGLWKLVDDSTGIGPESALATLVIGIFFSLVFRTFSNVLAPPLFCIVDESLTIHDCPLRFKSSVSQSCSFTYKMKWLTRV